MRKTLSYYLVIFTIIFCSCNKKSNNAINSEQALDGLKKTTLLNKQKAHIDQKFDSINSVLIKDRLLIDSDLDTVVKREYQIKQPDSEDKYSDFYLNLYNEPLLVGLLYDFIDNDQFLHEFSKASQERKSNIIKELCEIHCRRISHSKEISNVLSDFVNLHESKNTQRLFQATQFYHQKEDLLNTINLILDEEGINNSEDFGHASALLYRYAYMNIDSKTIDLLCKFLVYYQENDYSFDYGSLNFFPNAYESLKYSNEHASVLIYVWLNCQENDLKKLKETLVKACKAKKKGVHNLLRNEVSDDMKQLILDSKDQIDSHLLREEKFYYNHSYLIPYVANFGYDAIVDIMGKYPKAPLTEIEGSDLSASETILTAIENFLFDNSDLDDERRAEILNYLRENKFAASDNWRSFVSILHLLYPGSDSSKFRDLIFEMDNHRTYWNPKPSKRYAYPSYWNRKVFHPSHLQYILELGKEHNYEFYTKVQAYLANYVRGYSHGWTNFFMMSKNAFPYTEWAYDSDYSVPIFAKAYAQRFSDIIIKTELFSIDKNERGDDLLIVYTDRNEKRFGITYNSKNAIDTPNPLYLVINHILLQNDVTERFFGASTNANVTFLFLCPPSVFLKIRQYYGTTFNFNFYDINEEFPIE